MGEEQKKKILVVEDNPSAGDILKMTLEDIGLYETFLASDAMQAGIATQRHKPDLVILDIMLPAGGGIAVYNRMKQSALTKDIPIIITTATPVEKVKELMKTDNIREPLFKKPYDMEKLLAEIRRILGT